MKEILEYNGEIAMVKFWVQELSGYHFSVIHRPARMVIDVDGLKHRFNTLSSQHAHIVLLLLIVNRKACPSVYTYSII